MDASGVDVRCALFSFFDSRNIGDLLIGRMLEDVVSSRFETVPLSLSSTPLRRTDPEQLLLPRERGLAEQIVQSARHGARALGHDLGMDSMLVRARRWAGKSMSLLADSRVREILSRVDAVVIGGGNLMFDTVPWSRSWEAMDEILDYCAGPGRGGVPVAALSIGVGPFATERQRDSARDAVRRFDRVSFRDRYSMELMRSPGGLCSGTLGIDPVLGMKRQILPSARGGPVGVNLVDLRLSNITRGKWREYRTRSTELVRSLISDRDREVMLFSTDMADYGFLEEVCEAVGSSQCTVHRMAGISELLLFYSGLSAIVGSRMHSLITAYTQEIPFVALGWQPKVAGFLESVGLSDRLFYLDDVPNAQKIIVALDMVQREPAKGARVTDDTGQELCRRLSVDSALVDELFQLAGGRLSQ